MNRYAHGLHARFQTGCRKTKQPVCFTLYCLIPSVRQYRVNQSEENRIRKGGGGKTVQMEDAKRGKDVAEGNNQYCERDSALSEGQVVEGSTGYLGHMGGIRHSPGGAVQLHGELTPGLAPCPHLYTTRACLSVAASQSFHNRNCIMLSHGSLRWVPKIGLLFDVLSSIASWMLLAPKLSYQQLLLEHMDL